MKLNARVIAALLAGAIPASYLVLCVSARQFLHPNDAWFAARSLLRVALHRQEPACAGQLDHLDRALKSRVRTDGLALDGRIHSFPLPAMTSFVAASASGKHFVTVARPDGLTVRDLEAMAKMGWAHEGSFDGMDLFGSEDYTLNVSRTERERQCLTSLYVTVARR